jgi:hypothetical protein
MRWESCFWDHVGTLSFWELHGTHSGTLLEYCVLGPFGTLCLGTVWESIGTNMGKTCRDMLGNSAFQERTLGPWFGNWLGRASFGKAVLSRWSSLGTFWEQSFPHNGTLSVRLEELLNTGCEGCKIDM